MYVQYIAMFVIWDRNGKCPANSCIIDKRLGLGLGTGTWDLGPGTWDLGPRTWQ